MSSRNKTALILLSLAALAACGGNTQQTAAPAQTASQAPQAASQAPQAAAPSSAAAAPQASAVSDTSPTVLVTAATQRAGVIAFIGQELGSKATDAIGACLFHTEGQPLFLEAAKNHVTASMDAATLQESDAFYATETGKKVLAQISGPFQTGVSNPAGLPEIKLTEQEKAELAQFHQSIAAKIKTPPQGEGMAEQLNDMIAKEKQRCGIQ